MKKKSQKPSSQIKIARKEYDYENIYKVDQPVWNYKPARKALLIFNVSTSEIRR